MNVEFFNAQFLEKHSSEEFIKVPGLGLKGYIDSIMKMDIL